jgi:hypothetical protein
MHDIVIADCDLGWIKSIANSRLKATKVTAENTAIINPSLSRATYVVSKKRERGGKRRRAASIRAPRNDGDNMPSSKLQRPFKGGANHLEYQEFIKKEATIGALRITYAGPSDLSLNQVIRDM